MFFLIRTCAWFVGLTALAYVVVFVPLGEFTVWEHVVRISETHEAQDLGRDVESARERLGDAVQDEVRQLLREEAEDRQVVNRAIDEVVGGDNPSAQPAEDVVPVEPGTRSL